MAESKVLERIADQTQLANMILKFLEDKKFFAARRAAIKKFIAKKIKHFGRSEAVATLHFH